MRFSTHRTAWHAPCHISIEASIISLRRTTMKFETLMLHSLFAATLLVCVLTLGSMLTIKPAAPGIAASPAQVSATVRG